MHIPGRTGAQCKAAYEAIRVAGAPRDEATPVSRTARVASERAAEAIRASKCGPAHAIRPVPASAPSTARTGSGSATPTGFGTGEGDRTPSAATATVGPARQKPITVAMPTLGSTLVRTPVSGTGSESPMVGAALSFGDASAESASDASSVASPKEENNPEKLDIGKEVSTLREGTLGKEPAAISAPHTTIATPAPSRTPQQQTQKATPCPVAPQPTDVPSQPQQTVSADKPCSVTSMTVEPPSTPVAAKVSPASSKSTSSTPGAAHDVHSGQSSASTAARALAELSRPALQAPTSVCAAPTVLACRPVASMAIVANPAPQKHNPPPPTSATSPCEVNATPMPRAPSLLSTKRPASEAQLTSLSPTAVPRPVHEPHVAKNLAAELTPTIGVVAQAGAGGGKRRKSEERSMAVPSSASVNQTKDALSSSPLGSQIHAMPPPAPRLPPPLPHAFDRESEPVDRETVAKLLAGMLQRSPRSPSPTKFELVDPNYPQITADGVNMSSARHDGQREEPPLNTPPTPLPAPSRRLTAAEAIGVQASALAELRLQRRWLNHLFEQELSRVETPAKGAIVDPAKAARARQAVATKFQNLRADLLAREELQLQSMMAMQEWEASGRGRRFGGKGSPPSSLPAPAFALYGPPPGIPPRSV